MTVEEEVGAAFGRGLPKRLADLGGSAFLRGREEAIAHLRARGFGEASTAALVDQALALAAAEPRRG